MWLKSGVMQRYFFAVKAESLRVKETLVANRHVQQYHSVFLTRDPVCAARRWLTTMLTLIVHSEPIKQKIRRGSDVIVQ